MLDAALTNVVNNIDSRGRVVECDVPSDLPALRTDRYCCSASSATSSATLVDSDRPISGHHQSGVVGDNVQLLVVTEDRACRSRCATPSSHHLTD